jgi:2-keto-4-pentenoate hydratase/2-oxohepta-3-ene-1,7-dioic acid hydratase in catechol pathway
MRLVTFELETDLGRRCQTGALSADNVINLTAGRAALLSHRGHPRAAAVAAAEVPSDMLELLRAGEPGLEAVRETVEFVEREGPERADGVRVQIPSGEVSLKSPLPRPNSLRDFLVVEEHLRNASGTIPDEWYNIPVYYKGNVDSIYGPDDEIPWPIYTEKLDYELEICAVLGRPGRRISAEDAADHIVGYTIYNDWSARDIQLREMTVGLGPAMGKDFASSLGPCIATPDEFDRDAAVLQARIDGETWSEGVLGKMHFSFEQIIEWVSQEQTLLPGDLLGSGTVGRGCGLELDRWITPGCVVELEADGIGVLRNRVGVKQ